MRQGSKNPWIDFEEMQKDAKDPPVPHWGNIRVMLGLH